MSTALPGLRIGGVPVTVHPSFFLTALVLAFSLTGVSLEATILLMAIWVMVLLVAVIAHEMGHALVFRVMGVPSRIDVHSMGGTTTPLRGTALTPMRSFLVSLAGPLTGIGLALAIGGLLRVPGVSDLDGFLRYGVEQLLAVNLGLSLFNLLPIYPMDGAQATGAILRVVARRRADEAAIVVSTAAAAIVVAVALATRHSWIALVTALIWMWGFSAQRRTFATRGDEPLRGTLTGAADALTRRDWRAAVDGARQVISQRPSPDLRRKAATILTLAGIAARDLGVAEQGM
ncbi:MAG TPA: hypothetical protein VE219_05140, partial [Candidatus Sulfotelmatobacter sp.]|nr:hypothetical protein [Candidatus Sulfotelmatobacter sp.]